MLEGLKNFISDNPIIFGIIIGFIPSAWSGHWGNKWTERQNRKRLEAKQKKFIDGLSSVAYDFIYSEPVNEDEVAERRKIIKSNVKELSRKFFNQDYPEINSFRSETTEYPEINCKWCHRRHTACAGSKGDCKNCRLPLDLWIGSQGQPKKENSK